MRKAFPAATFLALLISAVAGAQFVNWAWANGIPMPPLSQIYIKGDGTVEPSTAPIQREGNLYTIVGALPKSSIEVQCSNIVIDGADFTLLGYGSHWYTAITLSNVRGVKIQNLNIRNFGWGIEIVGGSNNIIIKNKFEGCGEAIHLSSSDRNYIAENHMSDGYGVVGKGSFNVIIENKFTGGLSGVGQGVSIDFWGSNNNTIAGNYFMQRSSISVRGNYNTIAYNTLINGEVGISLIEASYNLVFRNTIQGKRGSYAFYLAKSYSNEIYENHFENNTLGVQIGNPIDFNTAGNTFAGNNFLNNIQDILIYGAPSNFWNKSQEGNYWSVYAGNDTDGNGIGDIPHIINVNNVDNHPLMQPTSIPEAPDFKLIYPVPTINTFTSPSPTPQPTVTPNPTLSPTAIPTPTPSPKLSPSPEPQNSEPFPTALVTASATTIAITSAGILSYFKKRNR